MYNKNDMKFIHCADLHLDSKMEALSSEKSKIRRSEIVSTFERLCEYAESNGVTAVIIAGDAFDTERVTVKTRERIFRAVKSHENVDFLYLKGNHDDKVVLEDAPENLKTFGSVPTYYTYGDTVICGVEVDKANSLNFYDAISLDKDKVNIVTLHGQVAGYKSRTEAEVLSLPRLKDKNIDYLALGHVHEYVSEKLDARGTYCYSGCLEGRGFDETGDKGFVLIDVENKKLSTTFVPFAKRKLCESEFDITGYDTFYSSCGKILSLLKGACPSGSLVKIVLKGTHGTDFIVDKERLAETCADNFFYTKVYDKTELKIDKDDYADDKSVRGEFVRAVMESDISEDVKSKVILCGLNALMGEEI